jgi:hypothetical protein
MTRSELGLPPRGELFLLFGAVLSPLRILFAAGTGLMSYACTARLPRIGLNTSGSENGAKVRPAALPCDATSGIKTGTNICTSTELGLTPTPRAK